MSDTVCLEADRRTEPSCPEFGTAPRPAVMLVFLSAEESAGRETCCLLSDSSAKILVFLVLALVAMASEGNYPNKLGLQEKNLWAK